jgi:DNA replicative helicase MCM subunit Mcm2 (Cdc46/Mcm family)
VITAQSILFEIHRIVGEGRESAPLKMIAEPLLMRKISEEEIEEALDHLLMQGEIHEVEDNCFIAEE